MIALVCLLGSNGFGVPDAPKESSPAPFHVADVIKGFGLDESKMHHSDEPPGKLREVYWSRVKLPGTDAEVNISVDLVYTVDLFSTTRKWDIKKVRAAKVTKVTISPLER